MRNANGQLQKLATIDLGVHPNFPTAALTDEPVPPKPLPVVEGEGGGGKEKKKGAGGGEPAS